MICFIRTFKEKLKFGGKCVLINDTYCTPPKEFYSIYNDTAKIVRSIEFQGDKMQFCWTWNKWALELGNHTNVMHGCISLPHK